MNWVELAWPPSPGGHNIDAWSRGQMRCNEADEGCDGSEAFLVPHCQGTSIIYTHLQFTPFVFALVKHVFP